MTDSIIPETIFSISFILEKLGISTCCLENLEKYESREIAKGLGFFSKIIKITFYWKDSILLPKSIVLKIPVANGYTDHLEYAFQRELNFYQIFGKFNIKVPKFYYGYPFHRHHNHGIMILEDLSTSGCNPRMLPGLTNEQVEAVIDELAKINVISWQNHGWYESFIEDADQAEFLTDMYGYALDIIKIQPEAFENLVPRTKSIYTYETYKKVQYTEDKYGFPPSIVHSDLWAPNIIFEKDENGNPTSNLLTIIDWQNAHPGNPCEDITRLLFANTTGEYRRSNTQRLLKFYKERVEFYNNNKALFTLDQLLEAYKASLGYTLAFFSFGVPHYHDMENVVDGTYPGEYKEELLNRVRMCSEDVIQEYGL
uniref:CHK kinase-like domain-containing protein n=1 Tax=Acrobeloides nanus TaxID=290746 RepID=A0A914CE68_9BILA